MLFGPRSDASRKSTGESASASRKRRRKGAVENWKMMAPTVTSAVAARSARFTPCDISLRALAWNRLSPLLFASEPLRKKWRERRLGIWQASHPSQRASPANHCQPASKDSQRDSQPANQPDSQPDSQSASYSPSQSASLTASQPASRMGALLCRFLGFRFSTYAILWHS